MIAIGNWAVGLGLFTVLLKGAVGISIGEVKYRGAE
jgi:hypothetical protein